MNTGADSSVVMRVTLSSVRAFREVISPSIRPIEVVFAVIRPEFAVMAPAFVAMAVAFVLMAVVFDTPVARFVAMPAAFVTPVAAFVAIRPSCTPCAILIFEISPL